MKVFIIKFFLLIVLVLVSIGILNFLYVNTNYWKGIIDSKFKNIPDHIQVANVGSSHGQNCFNYRNFPYRSFNFAVGSQRFFYDHAILRQYVNRFEKGAVLFIPVSYNQITEKITNFRDQRARYYQFLDKEYMDSYSWREKQLFGLFPVLSAGRTFTFIIEDRSAEQGTKIITGAELARYCLNRYSAWTKDRVYKKEIREEGFAYNKYWASQIIEFCYKHDLQPVLVTTPLVSILNKMYAEEYPEFFDEFYRFTDELRADYPSLLYFDYSHDPRFENDFSLFSDGDHLNTAGAEKFTGIVMSDLRSSGIVIPGL